MCAGPELDAPASGGQGGSVDIRMTGYKQIGGQLPGLSKANHLIHSSAELYGVKSDDSALSNSGLLMKQAAD